MRTSAALGDAAFDQLVRTHRASLERYVRGLGASREDAEEVVATALLRAYQNPPDAHLEREWRAWLSTVARNLWIDERRRRQVRLVAGDGVLEAVPSPPVDHVAATRRKRDRSAPRSRSCRRRSERRCISAKSAAQLRRDRRRARHDAQGRDRDPASRPRQRQAPSRWDRRGLLRSRALATGSSCAAEQEPRAPSVRPAPRPRSSCPSCWWRAPAARRWLRSMARRAQAPASPEPPSAGYRRRAAPPGEACRVRDSRACHHPPAPARKGGVVPTRRPHASSTARLRETPIRRPWRRSGRSRGRRDRRACRFEHGFSSRQAHARRAGAACSEGAPAAHTERIGAALPKAARPRATRGRRSAWELRYPA